MESIKKIMEKMSLELAESIVGTLRDPILILDEDLRVVSTNQAFYKEFKVSKEATIGEYIYHLGNGQWKIPSLCKLLEEILPASSEVNDYEITHDFPSIGLRTMQINARRIVRTIPPTELIFLSIEDITERMQKEQALRDVSNELYLQKEKAEATLLSIGDGFISTDIYGHIFEMNEISVKLTGYSREEAIGKPFASIFKMIDEKTRNPLENPVAKVLKTKKPTSIQKDAILVARDGSEYYIEDSVSPIKEKSGIISGVVFIYRDITLLKNKIIENEYLSNHDYLTDLQNRRSFTRELKRLDTKEHYPLGIMMMDVNGLKIFNDAFGHKVGDQVLQKIADVLKRVFINQKQIFRIGGDEFAVVLATCSLKTMKAVKEEILDYLKDMQIENIVLSLAIGYALKNDEEGSLEDVLKYAENDMYKYKLSEGKSTRNSAIKAILNTLTSKYESERIHSNRVSELCVAIGRFLGFNSEDLKELEIAGLYHDIGKISIPDNILFKPGKLTDLEFGIIKNHTEIGYQILRAADEYSNLAKYAYSHHEHWNGRGYPLGLKGKEIPLFSRIIGIADSYEAMTSERIYRAKMTEKEAGNEIIRCSGTQFDPVIAEIFVKKVLKIKPE